MEFGILVCGFRFGGIAALYQLKSTESLKSKIQIQKFIIAINTTPAVTPTGAGVHIFQCFDPQPPATPATDSGRVDCQKDGGSAFALSNSR